MLLNDDVTFIFLQANDFARMHERMHDDVLAIRMCLRKAIGVDASRVIANLQLLVKWLIINVD